MEMVDLILRVCLSASPVDCRDEHLYFESRGSLMQCMFLARAEIAKWSEEHPNLKIVRWRCNFPGREQAI